MSELQDWVVVSDGVLSVGTASELGTASDLDDFSECSSDCAVVPQVHLADQDHVGSSTRALKLLLQLCCADPPGSLINAATPWPSRACGPNAPLTARQRERRRFVTLPAVHKGRTSLWRLIFQELDGAALDRGSCFPAPRCGWGCGA